MPCNPCVAPHPCHHAKQSTCPTFTYYIPQINIYKAKVFLANGDIRRAYENRLIYSDPCLQNVIGKCIRQFITHDLDEVRICRVFHELQQGSLGFEVLHPVGEPILKSQVVTSIPQLQGDYAWAVSPYMVITPMINEGVNKIEVYFKNC